MNQNNNKLQPIMNKVDVNTFTNNMENTLEPIMNKVDVNTFTNNIGNTLEPIMNKVDVNTFTNNMGNTLEPIMNKIDVNTSTNNMENALKPIMKRVDYDVNAKNSSLNDEQNLQVSNSVIRNMSDDNLEMVKPTKLEELSSIITINECNYILGNDYWLKIEINGRLEYICNFIPKPKKKIIEDNGIYTIQKNCLTCFMKGGKSRDIFLYSKDLLKRDWIKDLGIEYYCSEDMYDYLEKFISFQFEDIEKEFIYTHIGWRNIQGKMVYLHGNGAIGLNSDEYICGSKDKVIECINITSYQAINESLKLLAISDDLSKTLLMFLFSHLSVARELFVQAGVEPKFCLWIYGLTGSMKTSVSKVFFNIFNTGKKQDITATFKDTIAAIEMKSFEYKDSVLLVDDFHPTISSQEKKEMYRLASEMLRRYGDGICRARATKDMNKQKVYPPRGLCVITGEDKIGGESTVARYISIEVKPGDFKSQELAYFQNNPCIFSTHIYYFIEWLSNNFAFLKEYIKQQFIKIRNENINKFRHGRMNEAFAIFSVIADIFLIYTQENGFIDLQQKEIMLSDWRYVIFSLIKTHENSNIQQSPVIMYLTAIKELIGSGKLCLTKINDYKDKEKSIAYESEEKIYLLPKLVYAEIKSFWKSQGIEFPISEESVNKMLDESGVIEVRLEGKTRRRTIKISGDNRRFLVIDKAKMESILEGID